MRFFFGYLLYFSKTYWKYNWSNVVGTFLKILGGLWLIVEASSYFVPQIADWTRGNWQLLLVCTAVWVLWALIKCRSMSLVSCRLNGREISIEIRIGDLFDIEGAFIISTNTTFDTDMSGGLISSKSLQGQFTKEYYDKVEHLDRDLEEALKEVPISGEKIGKTKRHEIGGKTKCYEIGTVARVCPKGRIVYLVAIAHMNENGKAYSSFEEVIEGLGKLWYYIGEQGELEPLVVPVLGTGLARLSGVTREKMIREIIKSFVAACSEKKFCEILTIVISESDYRKHEIDLQELGNYLRYHCKYTDLKNKTDTGKGKVIP